MPLKLMYITPRPEIAEIAQTTGVDRIFVDMEYIGKSARQGGMDTVQSHHTFDDIKRIKSVQASFELLVRCNPIHDKTNDYESIEEEIDGIIACGADIIMLPYFKTAKEVARFLAAVKGRAKTMLLFETPESVETVDEILSLDGIDEVFIGLNDLSLGYGMKFMFQLLADGTVERLCEIFRQKGIPYGFGGIAALGKGMLPAEYVIKEHYRLGSTCAILSRSFCNTSLVTDLVTVGQIFEEGIAQIRSYEMSCAEASKAELIENKKRMDQIIQTIKESQR